VALRPIIPQVPWELPNAIRNLNPMMISASQAVFNQVDPQGNPMLSPIVNDLVNFGWEYVFHCHILSHEEMDMMRPVSVAMPPLKPDGLAYSIAGNGNNARIVISWNDNSINETSFLIQRSTDGTLWVDAGTDPSPLDQPNTHGLRSFTDPTANASAAYLYRVVAQNTVGYLDPNGQMPTVTATSQSDTLGVNKPAAPTTLTATLQAGPQVSLTFRDNATNETGFVIERSVNGGAFAKIATAPARNNTGNVTFVDSTAVPGATNDYRVAAVNVAGMSAYSNTAQVVIPAAPVLPVPFTFTAANGTNGTGSNRTVNLTWTAGTTNLTGFTIQRSTNAAFTTQLTSTNVAATATSLTVTGLSRNTNYYFRIRANNGSFVFTAWVNASPFPIRTNP
jgi:Fibronectin type III domain